MPSRRLQWYDYIGKPIFSKHFDTFGRSLFSTLNLDSILKLIVLDPHTDFQGRNDREDHEGKARIFYISFS